MRLLICGDREWTDKAMIHDTLAAEAMRLLGNGEAIECVIEGEARGADTLAGEVALELGLRIERHPAQWKTYGKRAGPLRNAQMIAEGEPDEVWAFHDDIDSSKGTKNMISQARRAAIPVRLFSHRYPKGVGC